MTGTNAMYMWGGGGVGGDIRERWVATDPVSPLVQPHEPKLPTHHFNSVMRPAPIWGRLAATPLQTAGDTGCNVELGVRPYRRGANPGIRSDRSRVLALFDDIFGHIRLGVGRLQLAEVHNRRVGHAPNAPPFSSCFGRPVPRGLFFVFLLLPALHLLHDHCVCCRLRIGHSAGLGCSCSPRISCGLCFWVFFVFSVFFVRLWNRLQARPQGLSWVEPRIPPSSTLLHTPPIPTVVQALSAAPLQP